MKKIKREIKRWSFWKIALVGIICLAIVTVIGYIISSRLETRPIETVIIGKTSNAVNYFIDEDLKEEIKNKDYDVADAYANTQMLLGDYNYEYLDPNKPVRTKGKLKKYKPYSFQTNSPDALYLYEFYADNIDEFRYEQKHGYNKINKKLVVPVDKIICFNTFNKKFSIYRPSLTLKWNEVEALKEANLYWMNNNDDFSNNFFSALSSIIDNMVSSSPSNMHSIKAHNRLAMKKIKQQKTANGIWHGTGWLDLILLVIFGLTLIYKYTAQIRRKKRNLS